MTAYVSFRSAISACPNAGSGTTVADVNKLLKQFEMMQKMMKQLKKSPKGFARKLGGLMGNPGAFRGMK